MTAKWALKKAKSAFKMAKLGRKTAKPPSKMAKSAPKMAKLLAKMAKSASKMATLPPKMAKLPTKKANSASKMHPSSVVRCPPIVVRQPLPAALARTHARARAGSIRSAGGVGVCALTRPVALFCKKLLSQRWTKFR